MEIRTRERENLCISKRFFFLNFYWNVPISNLPIALHRRYFKQAVFKCFSFLYVMFACVINHASRATNTRSRFRFVFGLFFDVNHCRLPHMRFRFLFLLYLSVLTILNHDDDRKIIFILLLICNACVFSFSPGPPVFHLVAANLIYFQLRKHVFLLTCRLPNRVYYSFCHCR